MQMDLQGALGEQACLQHEAKMQLTKDGSPHVPREIQYAKVV